MRLFAPAFALVAALAVLLAPGPATAAEDSEILLEVTGQKERALRKPRAKQGIDAVPIIKEAGP